MRKVKGLLGIVVGSFLLLHAGAIVANADSPGNNGTLKIIGANDAEEDMDNDPKPGCVFHLSGFHFDGSSTGTWSIAPQGGANVAGSSSMSGSWGPADASGHWMTGNITLASGMYKATAKQTRPSTPGGDKQKVFKIECGSSSGSSGSSGGSSGSSGGSSGSTSSGGSGSNGTTSGGATTGSTNSSGAASASSSSANSAAASGAANTNAGAQGSVSAPTGEATSAQGVQGEVTGPSVTSLPSTATADASPIAGIGALLMGFGVLLLRRRSAID